MIRPRSSERSLFRFCPFCGTPLETRPGTDEATTRPLRPRCSACGFVQYRNPVAGVAAVIFEESDERRKTPSLRGARVLLARRRAGMFGGGLWCLPCGYVEFDEDVREAVRREAREETGLEVEIGEVLAVHSNFHEPDRQTVGIWFRAERVGGALRAGDDVDDLRFVESAAPGVTLAFPTDELVLAQIASAGKS